MGRGGVEKVQALGRRASDTLCSFTLPAILVTPEVLSPQEDSALPPPTSPPNLA